LLVTFYYLWEQLWYDLGMNSANTGRTIVISASVARHSDVVEHRMTTIIVSEFQTVSKCI